MASQAIGYSETCKVIEVRNLSEAGYSIKIERHDVIMKPGQCANLSIAGIGVNREYSLYSGEKDNYLEFLIKEIKNGIVSSALRKLKPNDKVEFDGPYGSFLIEKPEDRSRKYVFIGSGTGIAPYRSFVRSYPNLDYKIIHGIRDLSDAYDSKEYAPGRYISCTSRSKDGDFHGRVTDYLLNNPVDKNSYFYLCGNKAMISDTYDLLREEMGVKGDQIIMEAFF